MARSVIVKSTGIAGFLSAALWFAIASFAAGATAANLDGLSPTVVRIKQAATAGDSNTVDKLMHEALVAGSPIVERDSEHPERALFTFVAKDVDPVSPPSLFGVFEWGTPHRFERIGATRWWTTTVQLPATARSGYWLAWPRGRTADAQALTIQRVPGSAMYEVFDDPLAGHSAIHFDSTTRTIGRYGWFSGPDAEAQPYLTERPNGAHGTLVTREVESDRLGNTRKVSVYTPPGYDPRRRGGYDLLVAFDREEFLSTMAVPTLLDNMIADGAIAPLVGIFISAIGDTERNVELPGNAAFESFVHDELLPPLVREFAITRRPERTVIAGASYGGLCATLSALRYPQRYGNVLSQSGAFWWGPQFVLDADDDDDTKQYGETVQRYVRAPRLPLRFYMDVGLLEGDVMVLPNRHLRDVLIAKGYPVTYREVQSGHDWISWRATLPAGLIALLGPARSHRR